MVLSLWKTTHKPKTLIQHPKNNFKSSYTEGRLKQTQDVNLIKFPSTGSIFWAQTAPYFTKHQLGHNEKLFKCRAENCNRPVSLWNMVLFLQYRGYFFIINTSTQTQGNFHRHIKMKTPSSMHLNCVFHRTNISGICTFGSVQLHLSNDHPFTSLQTKKSCSPESEQTPLIFPLVESTWQKKRTSYSRSLNRNLTRQLFWVCLM